MDSNKQTYRLINPFIDGSINPVVKASNSFNAGKKMYNKISDFFTNQVDNFYMTIQNIVTNDLTHFLINEKKDKNDVVNFNLVKINDNFDTELENKIVSCVDKVLKNEQTGGKHRRHARYDDDSSSDSSISSSDSNISSSDSEHYSYPVQPINKFIYFYLPYYKLIGMNPLDSRRIFLPMFGLPINPSLEIRFDFYKY